MRVISLASGSGGNALLVEAGLQGRTKLLVDAGLRMSVLSARLRAMNVHPGQLQGILVTHEHSDHVLGVPMLMKRYALPIITDPRTYRAIEQGMASGVWRTEGGSLAPIEALEDDHALSKEDGFLGELSSTRDAYAEEQKGKMFSLAVGTRCSIGDIEVTSFATSHDAVAPCGYLLQAGGCRVCIVTDSGEVTPAMLAMMQQADLLILEANHDRERLLRGPYRQSLKRRILSSLGHLSNDQAAEAILQTWRVDGVRWLWLSHLSRINNTPRLALHNVRTRLQSAQANLAQVHISVLPPGIGHVWDSTQLWHVPAMWEMQG